MKLSRLLLISAVLVSLTSCDDLFEPALENNQDISEMYTILRLPVVFLTMLTWLCHIAPLHILMWLQMMLSPTKTQATISTIRRWLQVLGLQI